MWNWTQWDSHKQRWGTAILIAIPVLILLSVGPYWTWCLLVASAGVIGLWEFQGMVFREGLPYGWQALYYLTGLLFPLGAALGQAVGLHAALFASLLGAFSFLLIFSPRDHTGISRLALLSLGWLYIPYLLSYVLLIGKVDSSRAWIFFALVITVLNDTGAFYCGRTLGRHKLYELVSPKKTIEGSIGGLLCCILGATCYGFFFLGETATGWFVLLGTLLGIIGQTGDLIESLVKRMSGTKDSSRLLPGHGGVLDRLDSLLFVFPVLWFFLQWID